MIYDDLPRNITAATFFILLSAGLVLNFVRYMHMFQLGGYHASAQVKWLKGNFKSIAVYRVASLLCFAVLSATAESVSGYLAASVIALLALFFSRPKKAKKKLVFTPRVIRMCVTGGLLYIMGAAVAVFYGVYFLAALAFMTEYAVIIANFINKPVEFGVNRYYINDAKRIINELPNLTVFGITGSYGKTSTKYFLKTLLSAKYNVLMTPESYNTTMGVVKTIRSSLNAMNEIFICEMGAKGVGEIKEICDIVKPKHSMITSIGPQHLETFKSVDNIIKTKFEIADCIAEGMVFLNYDNVNIRQRKLEKNVVKYGISPENEAVLDYYADSISVSEKGTSFFVRMPDGERYGFETKLIGEHNVQNIVGAIAAAHSLGVSADKLKYAVKRLESVPHRLELINGGADRLIIDDAFNSNPGGAKAAIDAMSLFDGVKILITPGMVELGEKEYALNAELGSYAADVCDYAVLVGEKRAEPIKEGLLLAGFKESGIKIVSALNEGLDFANKLDTGGKRKIILLENDLPDNY